MLSESIVKFANEGVKLAGESEEKPTDFYVAFQEYFSKLNPTPGDKEAIHKAFFDEVGKHINSNNFKNMSVDAVIRNSDYRWSFFSVVDATVNAILPQVLLPKLGMFVDLKTVGIGDVVKFTIKPNEYYTVSSEGGGERTTHRVKSYNQDIVISPKGHIITVYSDMYRVMAGKEDIADFIVRIIRSIEKEFYSDSVNALLTGLNAISGALSYEGAFDAKQLIKICQLVTVKNGGVKPTIIGSEIALMNVLPDSASGYRFGVDGVNGSVTAMKNFYGYDLMPLEQAYAGNDKLILPEDKLFIISPVEDKLLKGVITNSMDNSNEFYDNADLTKNFTMRKMWGVEYASAASAGVYTIGA